MSKVETVNEIVNPLIKTAKSIAKKMEHAPTWFIGNKDGMTVIQTHFSNNQEKDLMAKAIKMKLMELEADFYVFIHEAYMLQLENPEDYNPNKPVKEQAGNIECLFISYKNREGFGKMWVYPIKNSNGKRILGKPQIADNRDDSSDMKGRMVIEDW